MVIEATTNMCMSVGALELFLSTLDPSIVKIISDKIIMVQAEMERVFWVWVEVENKFCINGVGTSGDLL